MACGRATIGAGEDQHPTEAQHRKRRLQQPVRATKGIEIDQIETALIEIGLPQQTFGRLLAERQVHAGEARQRPEIGLEKIHPLGIGIIQPERQRVRRLGRAFQPPAQTTDAATGHQIQPVLGPLGPGGLMGSQQNGQVPGWTRLRAEEARSRLQTGRAFAIVRILGVQPRACNHPPACLHRC